MRRDGISELEFLLSFLNMMSNYRFGVSSLHRRMALYECVMIGWSVKTEEFEDVVCDLAVLYAESTRRSACTARWCCVACRQISQRSVLLRYQRRRSRQRWDGRRLVQRSQHNSAVLVGSFVMSQPRNLCELMLLITVQHGHRPSGIRSLKADIDRRLSFGSRAFRISAPKICITPYLPHILQSQTLDSFRRHLKTDYVQLAYPAP